MHSIIWVEIWQAAFRDAGGRIIGVNFSKLTDSIHLCKNFISNYWVRIFWQLWTLYNNYILYGQVLNIKFSESTWWIKTGRFGAQWKTHALNESISPKKNSVYSHGAPLPYFPHTAGMVSPHLFFLAETAGVTSSLPSSDCWGSVGRCPASEGCSTWRGNCTPSLPETCSRPSSYRLTTTCASTASAGMYLLSHVRTCVLL